MRINVATDGTTTVNVATDELTKRCDLVANEAGDATAGCTYGVRLYLTPPADGNAERAITFWLPDAPGSRADLAAVFERMADLVDNAPPRPRTGGVRIPDDVRVESRYGGR